MRDTDLSLLVPDSDRDAWIIPVALPSALLQVAGRALLGALFVTSEILIHLHLAADTMWSYAAGSSEPATARATAPRLAIDESARRAPTPVLLQLPISTRGRAASDTSWRAAC
jgi:hypothetical protein